MAIERLLEALDDRTGDIPADSAAFAILRARLVADAADAVGQDAGAATHSDAEISNAEMSNLLAAYLDGRLSAEDRARLINLLAKDPDARAALESAAGFLDTVEPQSGQVSPALMAEAMAVFAPNAVVEPVAAAAAAAPMPAASDPVSSPIANWFNWRIYGALAATVLVGVIGGTQLWHHDGQSGPRPASPIITQQGQGAPPPPAASQSTVSQPAPAGAAATSQTLSDHRASPEPLAKSSSEPDCHSATAPTDGTRSAAAVREDKVQSQHTATPKPCPPLTLHPAVAPQMQQEPAAKPVNPAPLGSPY